MWSDCFCLFFAGRGGAFYNNSGGMGSRGSGLRGMFQSRLCLEFHHFQPKVGRVVLYLDVFLMFIKMYLGYFPVSKSGIKKKLCLYKYINIYIHIYIYLGSLHRLTRYCKFYLLKFYINFCCCSWFIVCGIFLNDSWIASQVSQFTNS